MKTVYLLWCADEEGVFLEGVFQNEEDAEKEMQSLQEHDKEKGVEGDYFYQIQEKELK